MLPGRVWGLSLNGLQKSTCAQNRVAGSLSPNGSKHSGVVLTPVGEGTAPPLNVWPFVLAPGGEGGDPAPELFSPRRQAPSQVHRARADGAVARGAAPPAAAGTGRTHEKLIYQVWWKPRQGSLAVFPWS